MNRHFGALCVCTLASIVVCSIVGELIAPTRALSPLPSFLVFSILSALCAPIAYLIMILITRFVIRNKEDIEVPASVASFVVTLIASVAFAVYARTA